MTITHTTFMPERSTQKIGNFCENARPLFMLDRENFSVRKTNCFFTPSVSHFRPTRSPEVKTLNSPDEEGRKFLRRASAHPSDTFFFLSFPSAKKKKDKKVPLSPSTLNPFLPSFLLSDWQEKERVSVPGIFPLLHGVRFRPPPPAAHDGTPPPFRPTGNRAAKRRWLSFLSLSLVRRRKRERVCRNATIVYFLLPCFFRGGFFAAPILAHSQPPSRCPVRLNAPSCSIFVDVYGLVSIFFTCLSMVVDLGQR